jgi:hypothetical protein
MFALEMKKNNLLLGAISSTIVPSAWMAALGPDLGVFTMLYVTALHSVNNI